MKQKLWNVLCIFVRFEVFTAKIMKNIVFWDVAPCGSGLNQLQVTCLIVILFYSPALKMEAIRSSEMSVQTRPTWCYISEDDVLQLCILFIISTELRKTVGT
jgi:hypothetical protein